MTAAGKGPHFSKEPPAEFSGYGPGLVPVTSLLMPFTSPTNPVVQHGGLTESAISCQ